MKGQPMKVHVKMCSIKLAIHLTIVQSEKVNTLLLRRSRHAKGEKIKLC